MKKYAGSYKIILICILIILLIISPIIVYVFKPSEFSYTHFRVMCSLWLGLWTIFLVTLLIKGWSELFTYVYFEEKGIRFKTLFKEAYVFEYSKCADVGIAYQKTGRSFDDPKIWYIYFSYSIIDERYKSYINSLQHSKTFVKAGYSKKLHRYLLETLPCGLSLKLKADNISI